MFKLVVLFAVAAVAVARPGYLHQEIVPLATSYSSRVDVHHEPIVKIQEVVAPVVAVEPLVHAAPVYSAAVSYQSRSDIHHAPVVATYAHVAPVVAAHAVHGW